MQRMRLLLALLALVGVLLGPVAASAAAPACLHHGDGAGMVMAMDMSAAPVAAKAMPCCDDDAKKPTQHDAKGCMQACAVIGGVTAALPETAVAMSLAEVHARFEPALADPLHPHPPPDLKRPPKDQA
jgi:hypothetical protein